MLKKIIVSILSISLLISCWSDDTIDLDAQWLMNFSWDSFDISIPENWNILNDKQNLLPQPSEGIIELSVQSQEAKWGFFNNILILSDELIKFSDSTEFSIANNVWAKSQYIDYLELENKSFEFIDGTQSQLYTFEAKYNLETPKIKFIQTAYICNPKTWYLLTMAVSPSVKVMDKYETLLSTFTCTPKDSDIWL